MSVYVLLAIACVDIVVLLVAMTIFVLPFTCARNRYPTEPSPRVVQLAYPTNQRVPFSLFVFNTVVQTKWYVSSISQFAGARGTTASKVLAWATTTAACFQFVLALLLWGYDDHLVRFILLCVGAAGCFLIGFAESGILWKQGRLQQIQLLWAMMTDEQRRQEIATALEAMTTQQPGSVAINIEWEQLRTWIAELRAVTQSVTQLSTTPPPAYMSFKQMQMNASAKDITLNNDAFQQLILENDEMEKGVYANIHMTSAILLIFTTFAAHVIYVTPTRYVSFALAIIGLAAFIAFCMLQFISGNYDDSLPSWLPKFSKCPQTKPDSYGSYSKYALSILFICVEVVAFLSIVLATPVEAICTWYSMK